MTVTADRFESDVRIGTRVELVTPEGVPLVFGVATLAERVYAFTIDALWLAAVMLVLGIALSLSMMAFGELAEALLLLVFFVLRNGWFMAFELRGVGRSPGKRVARLRIVDSSGGPLQPMSIVVRNLTREVECFLPVVVLMNPEALVTAGPGWVRLVGVLWVLGFMLVPCFDKRRRRIGDLLAGTMVVREPRVALEKDLVVTREEPADSGSLFSARQLEMYGVYELQRLEELLRTESRASSTLRAVADKVAKKIAWTERIRDPQAFLREFYRAQRARLEHDLALGKARERKRDGRLG